MHFQKLLFQGLIKRHKFGYGYVNVKHQFCHDFVKLMMPVERCTQLLPQKDTYNLDQENRLEVKRQYLYATGKKIMSDYGKCLPTGTLVRKL